MKRQRPGVRRSRWTAPSPRTRTGTLRARVRTPSLTPIPAVSPFEREAGLLTRPKAAFQAAPVAHFARVYRWVSGKLVLAQTKVCVTHCMVRASIVVCRPGSLAQ